MSTAAEAAAGAERVAKRIARSGLCSRRDAERWIAAGRVAVDGQVLTSPALSVSAANLVTVDGEPLPEPEHARLFRYHKPPGLLTAARDPEGRPTIYDRLPAGLPRLMPVGRLDLTSEGLLLLTNDGALTRRLELPSTGWVRRYRARVHGRIGAGVVVSGRAPDGVIEAIEAPERRFCIGVQWHPEYAISAADEALFEALIAACRGR